MKGQHRAAVTFLMIFETVSFIRLMDEAFLYVIYFRREEVWRGGRLLNYL